MSGLFHPIGRLVDRVDELAVFGVGYEDDGPCSQRHISEGEQIVVYSKQTIPGRKKYKELTFSNNYSIYSGSLS